MLTIFTKPDDYKALMLLWDSMHRWDSLRGEEEKG